MHTLTNKFMLSAFAVFMAMTAMVASPKPAEAGGRHSGAIIGGIIGGIAIGAILAHKRKRHRSYYYRYDRPAYYHGGYYRPYSYYYAPRRRIYVAPRHRKYRRHW